MPKIKTIVFDWGDTLMKDFSEYEGPMADWEYVEIVDGVSKSLHIVSQSYICCVASNAGASNSELLGMALKRVDIQQYFQYLFTSRELGFSKPSLDFFSKIVQTLGFTPQECIMVGNDYNKDIIPAKKIGMQTIFFSQGSKDANFDHADYVMSSMENLHDIILEIEERNNIYTS
ncbi:HAD family hydrolase [Priestia megaterium]|uniref:HAD family hydrolase n=1 Tax=Priestia megaterium TaxID=1404 RepID=UPI000BF3F6E0|nr:HAD family hydrolase [Priestia megaterium]MED4117015.1 HAD family hydrolase [Priestia megaterium]PET67126.1 HAD family hydrolase [Priestia megaterium]PFK80781.1 HAD family hydrolase [Priestia megaterium]